MIYENENEKKVYILEMTVPWTSNRIDKLKLKENKYANILQNLKLEYPSHEVGQITLVMDVFGGYGQDLIDNIGKVINNKSTITAIIKNMQKSVVTSAANLSRTFKIRSMIGNS